MAENDGKIYITISNRRTGPGGEQPGAPEEKKDDKKGSILGDYIKHQFFNMIKSSAVKAVNYGIQNYGNFTGDYQTQRQLEDAKSLVNGLVGFGTAFISGSIAAGGNPIGGLIAVGIKTTLDIGSFAGQEVLRYREVQGQNYQIAQLRQLSGLNTLKDGSRGTEN